MIQPLTKKIIQQLRKVDLSLEDRVALTTVLLDKLVALPLSNTFIVNPEGITINGKKLDNQQMINFSESCNALKDNYARQVINEQIKYLAINLGVHNSLTLDTILFSKAALWNLQQQQELLDKII